MKIRNQLIILLSFLVVITILLNSWVSSSIIDKYFRNYVSEEYDKKVELIKENAIHLLDDPILKDNYSQNRLKEYISDPIVKITVINLESEIIHSVKDENINMHMAMMMVQSENTEEDIIELVSNDMVIGTLLIERYSSVQNSVTVQLFKNALTVGAIVSAAFVLIIAFLLTIFISSKVAKEMRLVNQYAKDIELNQDTSNEYSKSKIIEIKSIQTSLRLLDSKLKLHEKTRKENIDSLSHESRTPLTILKTNCEGALDGIVIMDESRLKSCLYQIDMLTSLLSNINELIEYKIVSKPLEITEFDLVKEIKYIVKGLKLQFESKGIKLLLKGSTALTVTTDKLLLSQCIYNLLTNAYKFTIEGGIVTITINENDGAEIEISDTGIGIKEEYLTQIFEAYYRINANSKIAGDGLGLYITKKNIELLGGEIKVNSQVGIGTNFIIKFKR
jgi:signal transduction histidine kinase